MIIMKIAINPTMCLFTVHYQNIVPKAQKLTNVRSFRYDRTYGMSHRLCKWTFPNFSPPIWNRSFWCVNKSDFFQITLCSGVLLHFRISKIDFGGGEIFFIHSMKFKFGIILNSSASQMRKIMINQILDVLTRDLFTKFLRNRTSE